MSTAALLLAAGGSTRLGKPKQLLLYHGESLIHRAARSLHLADCDPVIVVLGAEADRCREAVIDLPVYCIENSDWQRGIGTSIRSGVKALQTHDRFAQVERLLILLCDQPLIDEVILRRLIERAATSARSVVAARFDETLGPPVCVARGEFDALAALPDDRGAKLLWANRSQVVEPFDCPAAAIDVDTPEDWQRLTDS